MQLQPGERSLLAYFVNHEDALKAASELETMGYNEAKVDKIAANNRKSSASAYSLSALIAASDDPDHYSQYGPLLAASPTVSGYAKHEDSYTHMVTLVADNSEIDAAIIILKEYGARV